MTRRDRIYWLLMWLILQLYVMCVVGCAPPPARRACECTPGAREIRSADHDERGRR